MFRNIRQATAWLCCCGALVTVALHRVSPGQPAPSPPPIYVDPFFSGDGDSPVATAAQVDAVVEEMKAATEGTRNEEPTEEQKKSAELVKKYVRFNKIQRSPADIVRALAEQAEHRKPSNPSKPSTEEEQTKESHARLQSYLVTGEWGAIQEILRQLPADVAPPVYSHVLNVLVGSPTAVVLPDEVLPLADAAPGPLEKAHIAALAVLLRRSVVQVDQPSEFFAQLKRGSARLGGEDPQNRLSASRLLILAGFTEQASDYLPPLEKAVESMDRELLDLHALHQQSIGLKNRDVQALLHARTLSQMVLDSDDVDDGLRPAALARVVALLPKLPREANVEWLHDTFSDQRALAMEVLASLGQQVDTAFSTTDRSLRLAALKQQQFVVHELLTCAKHDLAPWKDAIELLALGWINEAQKSLGGKHRKMSKPDDNKIKPLPIKQLLPLRPNKAWRSAISPDIADHMERLTGLLAARSGNKDLAFETIKAVLPDDRRLAQEIAEAYLRNYQADSVTSDRHEEFVIHHHSYGRYFSPYQTQSRGIPLTRAKQVRNLANLAALLHEFEELGVAPLDDSLVVAAFSRFHSDAEVYREEDIQQVLGDLGKLRAPTIVSLVSDMRPKLAQQWRRTDFQEQAGTKRTDNELIAEIERGYQLATRMSEAAIERDQQNVNLQLLAATLYFDLSEFLYGQKVDLATYAKLREESFRRYQKAAESYVALLPLLPPNQRTVMPFQQWFRSSLGASDLAYLTRQDKPEKDQVEKIAAMLRQIDGDVANGHLKMFGDSIAESIDELPANLKPHFLRQSLRVLGDHPSGQPARDKLQYYDELLSEAKLHLELDGDANVGHQRSFGAWLSIRSTVAVGRESGGFSDLLGTYYSQSTGEEVDVKELLKQEIQEKWGEAFDVQTVRFLPTTVMPRGYGRTGWRETPLAYLVLAAKDPAVDRIPPVQLDLEFQDGSGGVLLPIVSQTTLISARDKDPPPRPASEIKIKQLLDDRELAEGIVHLEITASAKGLIPTLDQLLDVSPSAVEGFQITHIEDFGLDVPAIDTTGDRVAPRCERQWKVDLKPTGERTIAQFKFPAAVGKPEGVAFQRYADADIVDTEAVTGLSVPFEATPYWIAFIVIAAIALVGAVAYRFARRRVSAATPASKYRRPETITPFNVLVLLQRIYDDKGRELSDVDRKGLYESIKQLQQQYFSRHHAATLDERQLVELSDQWIPSGNSSRA